MKRKILLLLTLAFCSTTLHAKNVMDYSGAFEHPKQPSELTELNPDYGIFDFQNPVRIPGPGGLPAAGGGSQTWALVHETYCSSITCTGGGTITATSSSYIITVPSTGAGNTLVVWMASGNATTRTLVSITNGGDTFTLPGAACQVNDAAYGSIDAGYILSGAGGKTSFTLALNGASANFSAAWIAEYSHTQAPTFESCKTHSNLTSATSQPTPSAVTVTGTDVITQVALPDQSITAIPSPYTNPSGFTDGFGRAGAINQASYSVVNWTESPTGRAGVGAMSIK